MDANRKPPSPSSAASAACCAQAGFAVLPEFTLATGRRADVIAINPAGRDLDRRDQVLARRISAATCKWPEYRDYCDRLFFAIPGDLDPEIMPADTGLIVADMLGAEVILRQAPETPLHASRRKAVTLAFARSCGPAAPRAL